MPYYCKLPASTDLTIDQQLALEEDEAIALYTSDIKNCDNVILWRHIRNYEFNQKKSLLLVYDKTTEYYFKQIVKSINIEAAENINRTFQWINYNLKEYDEILIIDAQNIPIDKLEIIKRKSKSVSYSADKTANIYPAENCSIIDLKELFPDNEEYELVDYWHQHYNVNKFINAIFSEQPYYSESIKEDKIYIKPNIVISDINKENIIKNIVEIINNFSSDVFNIGILFPFSRQVKEYYKILEKKIKCSKYESSMNKFEELQNIHITTFKSMKHISFDLVILPEFDKNNWVVNNTKVKIKDYYYALTSARYQFLICEKDLNIDENLYELIN